MVHLVVFICVLFCFPSFLFSVNPLFQLYDPTQIYTKANTTTFFARRRNKKKSGAWCQKTKKGKKIELVENLGNLSFCHTKLLKDCYLVSESNNKGNLSPGDTIQVKLNENSLYFFEENSGIRIR